MLHYPGVIQKLGPLRQFWAMRFEARHAFFKQVSHVTCNFRNICKTMAFRHQMMQCHNILCGTLLCHNTDVGPGHSSFLANIEGFKEIQSCLEGIPLFIELYVPAWVTFKGTEYRAGMTVLLSYDPYGEPQFGLNTHVCHTHIITKSNNNDQNKTHGILRPVKLLWRPRLWSSVCLRISVALSWLPSDGHHTRSQNPRLLKISTTPETPPRPHERKRFQKYRREWEEAHPWLDSVIGDVYKANCKMCRRGFSVSHGHQTACSNRRATLQ